jgi:lipopolysaccharide export system protein LptA
MVAKSNNAVERIDAVGNVRFEGSAPASPSGTQTVRASGSKGSYQKQKLLLDLDGPVRFFSEQPTPDGKGRQSVAGRSDAAAYDEGRSVLTLSGNVEATVHTPETPQEGSTFTGDRVTVDMSERPYKVKITGGRVDIRLKDREPQSR